MTTTTTASPLDGAAPGDGTPIIETVGLTKTYSGTDFRAVDELNLRVESGEVFGLLGPNGAGKTTTIGVLTTRVIPTGGQALIAGIDVMEHPTLVKQLIGVVSQQNTLDRQLNPFENLYWHGRLFGMGAKESRQTAEELLERFQLTRFAKASVYALSGGMAQRLMVARAIFHRPAVLFLDEPTAGLDPQGRLALWELLEGLNAEGQTIMLTTHYMEEADKLCDRVAIMDHGKILALDTPADLKRSVGADTIVTVKADGDAEQLAAVFQSRLEGVDADAGPPRRRRVAGARRGSSRPARGRGGGGRWVLTGRPVRRRADARDGVHRAHRKGVARLMAATTSEAIPAATFGAPGTGRVALTPTRSATAASRTSLRALIQRDLVVLWKHKVEFTVRTLVQPFLLCFVFLYVFPKIGQGIGGGGGPAAESAFATVLVPGVVGLSIMFQGIQAVAMPLAQEFGFTREIEDRVQAPCPIWLVAISKVISGGAQGLLSAAIVLPIASVVHAAGVEAQINLHWLLILTLVPLSCICMASLGLLLGTSFEPRNLGLMFGFIVLPITFLGGTYYQWTRLAPVKAGPVHWLQIVVLVNPLIYINDGMRAAFTDAAHMHLYIIYPAIVAFSVIFLTLGLRNFRHKVLA